MADCNSINRDVGETFHNNNMKSSFHKWYFIVSWMPLVLFFLGSIYIKKFEGWGAWAASPILAIPVVFSIALGLIGIVMIFHAVQKHSLTSSLVLATLLSGCLGLWFLAKAIIFEIQRSF